jgi:hypothetical protein
MHEVAIVEGRTGTRQEQGAREVQEENRAKKSAGAREKQRNFMKVIDET